MNTDMAIWAEVNDRLAEMGLDEATWGDMRHMIGWSAQGAAEHIADLRRDAANSTDDPEDAPCEEYPDPRAYPLAANH